MFADLMAMPAPDLSGYGVDPDMGWYLGKCRVETDGRFWQPSPDGELSVIVPVMDGEDLVDLLVFTPAKPEKWALRCGEGRALGVGSLIGASVPVRLFSTPLQWLQHRGDGLMVLDWPAMVPILRCCETLVISDEAFARQVRKRLAEPVRVPRIIPEWTEA